MKIQRVVIIGGHIQALGLARQVAKKQVEVVLLLDTTWAVARFSRYVAKTVYYNTAEELHSQIMQLHLPNKATLLFPTNDEAVEVLSYHYEEYETHFAMGIPNPSIVALFNNKRNAYQYVADNGIPCPKCWYPNTLDEVREMATKLDYPVVVKPAVMYSFHATFGKKVRPFSLRPGLPDARGESGGPLFLLGGYALLRNPFSGRLLRRLSPYGWI